MALTNPVSPSTLSPTRSQADHPSTKAVIRILTRGKSRCLGVPVAGGIAAANWCLRDDAWCIAVALAKYGRPIIECRYTPYRGLVSLNNGRRDSCGT